MMLVYCGKHLNGTFKFIKLRATFCHLLTMNFEIYPGQSLFYLKVIVQMHRHTHTGLNALPGSQNRWLKWLSVHLLCVCVSGTRHVFVTCDICGHSGIIGIRWKCTQCHDYDLCQECYMSDKHDLTHAFIRFDTPTSIG